MQKLLLTSDWHLRSDVPPSRNDDFLQVQNDTLEFISRVAYENNAIILLAGDIFHRSKQENMQSIINRLKKVFKDIHIFYIAGNHDLKYHNLENIEDCNIGILEGFNNWYFEKIHNDPFFGTMNFFNFGEQIQDCTENNLLNVCVLHQYCEKWKLSGYIKNGIRARDLFTYNYNVFVTGDNHNSFEYEKNGKMLFNPGCITRQNLNEKDYKPSIILFDVNKKTYEKIYLPDNQKNVFKEKQVSKQIERNDRITSFVELLKNQKNITFDFANNLKKYCEEEKIDPKIIEKINEVIK